MLELVGKVFPKGVACVFDRACVYFLLAFTPGLRGLLLFDTPPPLNPRPSLRYEMRDECLIFFSFFLVLHFSPLS